MTSSVERILRLLGGRRDHVGRMLGGIVDSLVQAFENRRVGWSDETLRAGESSVQPFLLELYAGEVGQLRTAIREREIALPEAARQELFDKVDELVRTVVIPGYARLACRFTLRERNDFFLAPEPLHGLERFGWGIAGIALGALAIWAPFVPIWEKEWILPFAAAGLVFPSLRRFFALRRYQQELNRIVNRTDDEIWRMELGLMTSAVGVGEPATAAEPDESNRALEERLADTPERASSAPSAKSKQGAR